MTRTELLRTCLSLVLACGLLAACGGDDSDSPADASDPNPADTAAPTDTPAPTDTATDEGAPSDPGTPPPDPGELHDDGPAPDIGPPKDTGDPVEPVYGTPCPHDQVVGNFEAANWDFYASVTGEVRDGVIPLTVLQLRKEIGDCRLMQKTNPFCNPPCEGGQACTHDGKCIAFPANQSVGTVTIDGMLKGVTMEPNPVKSYSETDVPFPAFDAGAAITLKAAGGDLPGFEMRAFGVPMLELPDETIKLKKAEPLEVKWTASDGAARLYMALNIDQHGNSPVTLVCDVPDTGSYTVEAELVTTLLEFGVSGFASFDLYRRTVDSVMLTPGCVEFRVFSFAPGKLKVEGHTPCFQDPDCPDGQVCKKEINTCVDA